MRHPGVSALFLTIAAITIDGGWSSPATAQARFEHDYRLPAQPLADTIRAIALTSGTNILAAGEILAGKQAPELTGRLSTEEALALALEGSGLRVRATPAGLLVEADASVAQVPPDLVPNDDGTIVVTGTRIRGAPIASPVVTLTQDDIRNTGQATLGEVARSLPQSFGGGQQPGIGFNVASASGIDVGGGSSIDLRGLGPDATLTLLNGHRVAYDGSRQSVDVSSIPLSMVDRVEIVPDGASAIYGSDAVAGVANIILKRDFDGLETRARIGGSTDGGDFSQQYGALGGTTWVSGGIALAYEYNSNGPIRSDQRSYARDITPGLTLFPALTSHNLLLTGHQALGDDVTVSVDALYNRRTEFFTYPLLPGGDLIAAHGERSGGSRAYAIAPSLEWAPGANWRLTLTGTIAQDRTTFRDDEFIGTDDLYPSAGCYCNKERSVELGGSGALASVPAGAVKGALGVGYRSNQTSFSTGANAPSNFTRGQDSYYGYAEFSLPIVARAMAVRGVDRLDLTGAVRYENYPGIGDIATPKFGLIYAPDRLFDLKASWGKSFRAPTLRQQFAPTVAVLYPANEFGGLHPADATILLVDGGNPNLKPERATSWSATLAIHPPALSAARLEFSYFDTRYRDRIVSPVTRDSDALTDPIFANYVTFDPTPAQIAALIAAPTFINGTGAPVNPAKVIAIVDDSNVNAESQHIHGLDLLAAYHLALGRPDSSIDFTADATYLVSNQQITATLPVEQLAGLVFNPPHVRARGGVSWRAGPLTLTGELSYIGSVIYDRTEPHQSVGSMAPVDVVARYQTRPGGLTGGLDLILSIQNLFNDKPAQIPAAYYEAPYDSTNYSPVGRFISLSVTKRW